MPPKRKTPPAASEPSQPKPQKRPKEKETKALIVHEIIEQYGDLKNIEFIPFPPEDKRAAKPLLPTTFPTKPTPADYFTLFFTDNVYDMITKNTNKYASIRRRDVENKQREWDDMLAHELRVFIGAIIYMGVHVEPQIEDYWQTDLKKGPLHTIPTHISLRRFEQIKRYLHISCPEEDVRLGRNQPANTTWWYKLEPLSSHLQASFQGYYSPSSNVSIDELMVRCFGRSSHTYKMPNKPIKQGYKC